MPSPLGSSAVTTFATTGSPLVDALVQGTKWANTQLTYSFIKAGSVFSPTYNTNMTLGQQGLDVAQQGAVNQMLASIANVCKLTFTQAGDNNLTVGDIRIGFTASYGFSTGSGTAVYSPSATPWGGDLWLNPAAQEYVGNQVLTPYGKSTFALGDYAYTDVLAALLVSLGATFAGGQHLGNAGLPDAFNGDDYTLLGTYFNAVYPEARGISYYPTTPMLLDVAAMQALYGANTSYRAGDTVYSFTDEPGQFYNQTIWDGGGNNAIAYSGTTYSVIDLREGEGSYIGNDVYVFGGGTTHSIPNVWIAYGTHINSAVVTGAAPVDFYANDNGNTLTGGDGDDYFEGGAGADLVRGNGGADIIDGGGGTDTAAYNGKLADYVIKQGATPGAGLTVTDGRIRPGNDGADALLGVERLKFSDTSLALDMGTAQAGGKAALALGATLGALVVRDKAWAGVFLGFFDSGVSVAQGTQLLVDAGIMAALAGGADNAHLVSFVYNNVYGQAPDAATLASLVAPLDAHTTTQAAWMADMVLSLANQQHVNLTGLAASGWQYAG